MTVQHDERRGFVRVPFNTEVVINAGDWSLHAKTGIDVSMSGLHLTGLDRADSGRPLPGTSCRASIHLQAAGHQAQIEADGRIVRSKPGELAVEFIEIELEGYQHLRQLILNNADDPDRAEEQFNEHRGIKRL
ncbi:MAG: hypothetical protein A2X58_10825 [Nitrospirae bacterium GWC2_56_14]|nr:MAG: hypothetical protein A2X58_10825 [Nitrospirae bacterium GWC2_56_14]